jgi:hypothetical protein
MDAHFESIATRLEQTVIHFFSPSGLLTIVMLIVLGVILLGGSGIEHRMMEKSPAGFHQPAVSPILESVR